MVDILEKMQKYAEDATKNCIKLAPVSYYEVKLNKELKVESVELKQALVVIE